MRVRIQQYGGKEYKRSYENGKKKGDMVAVWRHLLVSGRKSDKGGIQARQQVADLFSGCPAARGVRRFI